MSIEWARLVFYWLKTKCLLLKYAITWALNLQLILTGYLEDGTIVHPWSTERNMLKLRQMQFQPDYSSQGQ